MPMIFARIPLEHLGGHSAPTDPQIWGLVLLAVALFCFGRAWRLMSRAS